MAKLPRLTAKQIIAVLEKVGTHQAERQSHDLQKCFRQARDRAVPFHSAKTLHPKVLKSILRDADLSIEDLEKLL